MKRSILLGTLAALLTGSIASAQTPDAPPVDLRQLLESLKQLREQNEAGIKTRKMNAYQQVAAAAASPERAVAYWKEAVKSAQFEGSAKEGSQLKDWRDGDGEALNDRLCANAVRLHLNWLALSLQHAAGVETKLLLPKVLEHINGVVADQQAADHFADQLDKAKDRGTNSPGAKKSVQEDSVVKRVHDQIMRMSVSGSPVSKWLQLGELLGDSRRKKEDAGGGGWELVPGNVDGIYNSVVLPEYRATKDPRLLEYWDTILRRETEKASTRQLDVEQREWSQVKRPSLLWARSQDVLLLGQRNRAILEMFNLIKTYPQHPQAGNWIQRLEELVIPESSGTTAPAPAGTVAPPAAIPAVPTVPTVPAPGALAPGARPVIR